MQLRVQISTSQIAICEAILKTVKICKVNFEAYSAFLVFDSQIQHSSLCDSMEVFMLFLNILVVLTMTWHLCHFADAVIIAMMIFKVTCCHNKFCLLSFTNCMLHAMIF